MPFIKYTFEFTIATSDPREAAGVVDLLTDELGVDCTCIAAEVLSAAEEKQLVVVHSKEDTPKEKIVVNKEI